MSSGRISSIVPPRATITWGVGKIGGVGGAFLVRRGGVAAVGETHLLCLRRREIAIARDLDSACVKGGRGVEREGAVGRGSSSGSRSGVRSGGIRSSGGGGRQSG